MRSGAADTEAACTLWNARPGSDFHAGSSLRRVSRKWSANSCPVLEIGATEMGGVEDAAELIELGAGRRRSCTRRGGEGCGASARANCAARRKRGPWAPSPASPVAPFRSRWSLSIQNKLDGIEITRQNEQVVGDKIPAKRQDQIAAGALAVTDLSCANTTRRKPSSSSGQHLQMCHLSLGIAQTQPGRRHGRPLTCRVAQTSEERGQGLRGGQPGNVGGENVDVELRGACYFTGRGEG